jgi:hypothetical protein
MADWPPLSDPHLLKRLAADDAEFKAISLALAAFFGNREFSEEHFQRGLGYPWERPEHSFRMVDGSVELLESADALDPGWSAEPRYPLLTIGSNGSPGVLARKLSGLDVDARDVVVLTGDFIDHEIAPCAHIALYGAVPATIVREPGTRVRAGLILATAAQVEVLTFSEIPYSLVRIDNTPFVPDLDVPAPESVFAYVSRTGSLTIDGEPVALAAVPAKHRVRRPIDQIELLGEVARLGAPDVVDPRELVARVFEDYEWATGELREALKPSRIPFIPEEWNVFSS